LGGPNRNSTRLQFLLGKGSLFGIRNWKAYFSFPRKVGDFEFGRRTGWKLFVSGRKD